MIWGCMATSGVGEVFIYSGRMNSTTYTTMLSQVLNPSVTKLQANNRDEYFQQDNAPCHTSRLSHEWFADSHIKLLEWPSQSPDMSPIEQQWPILKKNVHTHQCKSLDLQQRIVEEWQKIKLEVCMFKTGNFNAFPSTSIVKM